MQLYIFVGFALDESFRIVTLDNKSISYSQGPNVSMILDDQVQGDQWLWPLLYYVLFCEVLFKKKKPFE